MRKGIVLTCLFLLIITGVFYISHRQQNPSLPRSSVGTLKSFQSGEVNYHYYVSGEGLAVVLYPSLGRTASDFNELVGALNKAGYKTMAMEPRGFKDNSGTQREGMTLLDYGEDIKTVLNHEGLEDGQAVFLIGHAFGNRVVRVFGAKYPKLALKMVLLAAGTQKKKDINKDLNQSFREIFYFFMGQSWREKRIADVFFSKNNKVPSYWISGWSDKISKQQAKAMDRIDLENWEKAGGAPLLFIQGEDDVLTPPKTFSLVIKEKLKEQVTIALIKDAGHALLPEQPEIIHELVIDFLNN